MTNKLCICEDSECINGSLCDYCSECGMMGEHDDRCQILLEESIMRTDYMRDATREGLYDAP